MTVKAKYAFTVILYFLKLIVNIVAKHYYIYQNFFFLNIHRQSIITNTQINMTVG